MRAFSSSALVLGLVASLMATAPANAQYGMDKKQPKNAATPELPHCDRPLGTAAIQEPENKWWTQLGLSNPEALLKLFAGRSNCLRIVDRNGGLAMRNQEAALGASGDLRRGSNLGRGQVASADYFIIPDIANSDANTGGAGIGAIAGSLLPGGFGALAGGLRTKKAQAQALITLVDARTTEQVYVAEGVAQKTDISFGGGGGGFGSTGFGALAGGGYSDTDIGTTCRLARCRPAPRPRPMPASRPIAPSPPWSCAARPRRAPRPSAPSSRETSSIRRARRTASGGKSMTRTATAVGCPRPSSPRAKGRDRAHPNSHSSARL
jgi:curli biogenesis system outer membrane secretion channel CsgG